MCRRCLFTGPLAACFLWFAQPPAAADAALDADGALDEIVVTAGLRAASAAELPESVTVLGSETLRSAGVQHFRGRARSHPGFELGCRHLTPAIFPAPRHRRSRAVSGRAEPLGRLSHRRHRLFRCRHARDSVRRASDRGAARDRRAAPTAQTPWRGSSVCARPIPATNSSCTAKSPALPYDTRAAALAVG